MSNLTLPQKFTLIAFNGEQADKMSITVHLRNRCMIAAQLLDFILTEKMVSAHERYYFANDASQELKESEQIAYDLLNNHKNADSHTILEWVNLIVDIPHKQCDRFVNRLIDEMMAAYLVDIIPSLLGCDLYYQTAGIKMREYRSSYTPYHNEAAHMKEALLASGAISDEVTSLFWLLKQSNDLSKILSTEESGRIKKITDKLYRENQFAHGLSGITMKGISARSWKSFQFYKKELAKTKLGIGLVSKIPALDRSQSIFIPTEKLFADSRERIADVKKNLESKGHICEVNSAGEVTIMEIDNVLYEIIPDAVRMRVMNIHGVRLRRYMT